jgi:hypothetical protein
MCKNSTVPTPGARRLLYGLHAAAARAHEHSAAGHDWAAGLAVRMGKVPEADEHRAAAASDRELALVEQAMADSYLPLLAGGGQRGRGFPPVG